MGRIAIEPKGPFSWYGATNVLGQFAPMQRHWGDNADVVRLAFPLDETFAPVAVALRFDGEVLRGDVAGTDDLSAVTAQVARIFSLDYDGTDYPLVGERDPKIGALMAALPGLRPVCFTSPYETAAWAIISQRISMRQAARIQNDLLAAHGHPVGPRPSTEPTSPSPTRRDELTWMATKGTKWVLRRCTDLLPYLVAMAVREYFRRPGPEPPAAPALPVPSTGGQEPERAGH